MKKTSLTLLLTAGLCGACSSGPAPETEADTSKAESSGGSSDGAPAPDPAKADAAKPDPQKPEAGAIDHLRAFAAEIAARPERDAQRVKVQHLLVSFAGTGTRARRSKEEAEALAAELLGKIEAGEDFAELIQKHTDDSPPGIYGMVSSGSVPAGWYRRDGMVAAFGDVGWRLDVGQLGVAAYDRAKSPFGWHLIKRVE